jgi:hypothetical protein
MTNVINLQLQNITNMIIILYIYIYINDWYRYNMLYYVLKKRYLIMKWISYLKSNYRKKKIVCQH